ncbi:MAG: NTP transferase domain-containing protein [Syntrophales bacterium]
MQGKSRLAAIILAAGKGTRMKSELAKVLHPLLGAPMLSYPVAAAKEVGSEEIVVVIGHQADSIRKALDDRAITFVLQEKQLGTGHAVLQTRSRFKNFRGTILILCGDVPLLRSATIQALLNQHLSSGAVLTVLTTVLENPGGYGRVIKTGDDVLKIVEARDASDEEKEIREINTGIYCVDSGFLFEAVAAISNDNAQREYYLTDIVEIASRSGKKVKTFIASDSAEVMGINTKDDLEKAKRVLRERAGMPHR